MSERSTFHPFNWPDNLRQRIQRDPNGDGTARDVQDPHTWEDPDPSIRERLTPDTVGQWLAIAAFSLTAIGLLIYFYPVFSPAFREPLAVGGFVFLSYTIVVYLKGRQDGINRYIDMAKSIVYYGDDFDIRLGEEQGEKGNRQLFTPYVSLSYGGFNERKLLKRDLPYDASKIRTNIEDDAGEEPVVDRMNVTTVEKDSENFGRVFFTHASDLKHDEFGQYSDRYTALPNELDEDVVDDVNRIIDDLEHEIRTLRQKVDMHEESNADLRDLKSQQNMPQLEETIHLMSQLREILGERDGRKSATSQSAADEAFDVLGSEVDQ